MAHAVTSEMAGTVWKVLCKVGDTVAPGQDVVILESMKMEIAVSAEKDGTVRAVHVAEGTFVNAGDTLLEIE